MIELIGKGWTFTLGCADPEAYVPSVTLNAVSYDPVEGFELLGVLSDDVRYAWSVLFGDREQVECVGDLYVDNVPVAAFGLQSGLTASDYRETLERSEAPVTRWEAGMTVKSKRDAVPDVIRAAGERQRKRRNEQLKNMPVAGRPVNPEDMR